MGEKLPHAVGVTVTEQSEGAVLGAEPLAGAIVTGSNPHGDDRTREVSNLIKKETEFYPPQ